MKRTISELFLKLKYHNHYRDNYFDEVFSEQQIQSRQEHGAARRLHVLRGLFDQPRLFARLQAGAGTARPDVSAIRHDYLPVGAGPADRQGAERKARSE